MILPLLLSSLQPTISSCLWPQRPYHMGEDITVVGRGTCFVRVEARDHDHYWITCQVDYTGVEFSTQVNQGLVIVPNPQDILSWLDRVGSLIWLCWDIFLNLFDGPKGCNIGNWEGRCKGEVSTEKGLSGMSSEGQRIWSIKIDWAASLLIASSFTQHLWHHSS